LPSHSAAIPQSDVPLLDIERAQPLQRQAAQVRNDLVLDELPIALCRSGRDVASSLPPINARTDEIAHGRLGWFHIGALPYPRKQLRELRLRIALAAAKRVVLNLALAGDRIAAGVEL